MLNYILPPIIIVVSASVLIVFLFRKAKQIPAQNLVSQDGELKPEKKKKEIASALGQFGLKILEKIMQRLKLAALKFHNISNDWFHSIREKRQERMLIDQENIEKQKIEKNIDIREWKNSANAENKEEVIRPLIREEAVQPQKSGLKDKNQLEEALIRRIAVNPRDIEAYERLGDYYLEKESFSDSHECFSQVLRLSPMHRKAKLRIRRLEILIK